MSWIGFRDRREGLFMPRGLGEGVRHCMAHPINEDGLFAEGSLQLECGFVPGVGAVPILHFEVDEPWPVRLTLFLDARGTLLLGHKVGDRSLWTRLPTDLSAPTEGLMLTYCWNGPDRQGWLSLHDTETGRLWHTVVEGPMPISIRDARRLTTDRSATRTGPEVAWLAVADHRAPMGPQPGIAGAARVTLAEGSLEPIENIRPGQSVATSDGGAAQVVWSGCADVIALGRQSPLRLRAPFHGLRRDIDVMPEQRLHLGGSDVEYLFGVEEVCAAAGHLMDQRSVIPAGTGPVVRHWQLLLDRPAAIFVEGCALESFDPGPLLQDDAARALSVLANVPASILPGKAAAPYPVLQGFEAMTLAYSGAA